LFLEYEELKGAKSSTSSRSETLTPCNSPIVNRKSTGVSVIPHDMATLNLQKSDQNPDSRSLRAYEPRYFIMETRKCSNLGISLVGGNAVGIFVHSVNLNSLAYNAGLRYSTLNLSIFINLNNKCIVNYKYLF